MIEQELLHWSQFLNVCPQGSILMIQKQDIGINQLDQIIALVIDPLLESGVRGLPYTVMN